MRLPLASSAVVVVSALVIACAPAGMGEPRDDEGGPVDTTSEALGFPKPLVASQISVGYGHVCAISGVGVRSSLACWGSNRYRQLGIEGLQQQIYRTPQASATTLSDFRSISAGEAHTCVVRGESGLVSCWGNNPYGQVNPRLPNGSPPTTGCPIGESCASPTTVSGITSGIKIASGYDHTCVQRALDVRCWGRSTNRLLYHDTGGAPSTIPDPEPMFLATGDWFSCFRSVQNLAICWGRLPDANGVSWSAKNTNIGGLRAAIAVGQKHACSLHLSDGRAYCMGESLLAQAGIATSASLPNIVEPYLVPGTTGAVGVAAGARHSCVVLGTGRIKCWGANNYGQLGIGEATDYMTPVEVSSSVDFTAVAAGGDTTCALSAAGNVYCWGRNAEGQTGTGDAASSVLTPQRVFVE